MWGNYPGQGQGQSQHQHHHQHHGGYGPPTGPPPGFPAPQGYSGGYGGYNPPPGPPPGGYSPSYAPPPGPPGGYGGNGYGHRSGPPPIPNYNSYPGGGTPHMPPSGVQNYGPHYQGTDNRDMQPYFQYSQCTGKRKALLIGINYIGHSQGQLKGCINDVHNVRRFLLNHGYKEDDMVILTDDSRHQRQMPTKNNIIEAMQWLVRDAAPNDSLFFHYSGHGGQTKDLDGDEADGYDEVIYPVDYQDAGHIVDDDMHAIMVQPLPAGCRLTVIFDSCHSGSAIDLPYMYSTEGKIKEPNLAAEVGSGLFTLAKSYAQRDMSGLFQGAKSLFNVATGNTKKAEELTRRTKTSPADVISWAGCKDSQTSADTVEAGRATGAMSYAFISTLSQKPQQTYQELLVNIRAILSEKYSQKPQLSSSHPMDTSIVFIF